MSAFEAARYMFQYNTSFIDNRAMIGLLRRAYNHVDIRLMDHGIRVAYIVSRLLRQRTEANSARVRNICFLSALHDVGAYKTEEIDRIVQFETEDIRRHSVYGYLFVKNFTPLSELAHAVLHHHTPWNVLKELDDISEDNKSIAQLIYIADRLDIWLNMEGRPYSEFLSVISAGRGSRYKPELADLMMRERFSAFSAEEAECDPVFNRMQSEITFTHEEVRSYLGMVIFSIDFRSRHTVTHTMTTASISNELAQYLGVGPEERNQIIVGAMLHDIGKIGIPAEILEYPGRLAPRDMEIMRSHVDITEEILGRDIPKPIRRIALRHHEKLDGSGYPHGLTAEDLTTGERIVALADIVSALAGTRSYKGAYSKEQIITIISRMRDNGLIDAGLVNCMITHYDTIMSRTLAQCQPVMDIYENLQAEYSLL